MEYVPIIRVKMTRASDLPLHTMQVSVALHKADQKRQPSYSQACFDFKHITMLRNPECVTTNIPKSLWDQPHKALSPSQRYGSCFSKVDEFRLVFIAWRIVFDIVEAIDRLCKCLETNYTLSDERVRTLLNSYYNWLKLTRYGIHVHRYGKYVYSASERGPSTWSQRKGFSFSI